MKTIYLLQWHGVNVVAPTSDEYPANRISNAGIVYTELEAQEFVKNKENVFTEAWYIPIVFDESKLQ